MLCAAYAILIEAAYKNYSRDGIVEIRAGAAEKKFALARPAVRVRYSGCHFQWNQSDSCPLPEDQTQFAVHCTDIDKLLI